MHQEQRNTHSQNRENHKKNKLDCIKLYGSDLDEYTLSLGISMLIAEFIPLVILLGHCYCSAIIY